MGNMFSWIGDIFGGGDDEQQPQQQTSETIWPRVITMPEYAWTGPTLQAGADFVRENIERMRQGKYPTYYEAAYPTLKQSIQRPLRETYFGREGERGQGVLAKTYELGSIAGLGPMGVSAKVASQLRDYATKEKEIDEYLTKIGTDIMREESYRQPALAFSMPRGPASQLAYPQVNQYEPAGFPWEGLISDIAQTYGGGYGDLISSMADMFGRDQTTGTQYPVYSSAGGSYLPQGQQYAASTYSNPYAARIEMPAYSGQAPQFINVKEQTPSYYGG